ncbi:MAG: hypothetical protein MSIBF_02085 [Candidatus Altiarchaeales archaeon IMC4]|nr:MAG: hypothetical protein MSIBF_02085 [Candidatus Altiarchaeales archaeon IMC4]
MDQKEEYHLRKIVNELKSKRGRHTELISVYVSQGFDLNNIISQLANEQGTASNIKSKSTMKNVTSALEKTIQHLRLYKQTPPNGLAVFCGNVSEREGVPDLRIWAVEPSVPVNVRIYRCDQTFVTEPLEDLITPKDVYGLIAIDNKTATLARLRGARYDIITKLTSEYHGKHRAGGQSHRRFERIIEGQSHQFKVRVAECARDAFMGDIKNLRGLVIGGPAMTKDDFVDGDYLHHELKKKIIAVEDITYTDESGIRELINKAQDTLKDVELVRHKGVMQRFMRGVVSDGPVAYGADVEVAITAGAADTVMLSEKLGDEEIDRIYGMAKEKGALVEIISEEFEEGFQLANTFGGKAAILRFRI